MVNQLPFPVTLPVSDPCYRFRQQVFHSKNQKTKLLLQQLVTSNSTIVTIPQSCQGWLIL